jgi:hypothetical protein
MHQMILTQKAWSACKYATEEERRAAIAAQKAKLNYKKPIYNKTYNEKHKEYFREYFQTKVKVPFNAHVVIKFIQP